jgi:hypothetical protein
MRATFLAHLTQLDLVKLLKCWCTTHYNDVFSVEFSLGSFASFLQDIKIEDP